MEPDVKMYRLTLSYPCKVKLSNQVFIVMIGQWENECIPWFVRSVAQAQFSPVVEYVFQWIIRN